MLVSPVALADLSPMKTQCESLGYTPRTEKFADCVLELHTRSAAPQILTTTEELSPEAEQCIQMGFKPRTNQFGSCQLQLKQLAIQQSQFETQQRAYEEQMRAAQKQRGYDQAQALFGLANQALEIAGGKPQRSVPSHVDWPISPSPVTPLRVIPPSGDPFTCAYQGPALRCR
jgi:hypothetical protein